MDRETSLNTKKFAKAVKEQMEINRLILFGSRARGDNFITSDYDFIIVSRYFAGKPFTRRASPLYKLWHSNRDLEILCYTPEEWERLKDKRSILVNAQNEGIRLF